MDKVETNGFLRAIEAQIAALEAALTEVDRLGDLNDPSARVFREVKIDLVNLRQEFMSVRAWNMVTD